MYGSLPSPYNIQPKGVASGGGWEMEIATRGYGEAGYGEAYVLDFLSDKPSRERNKPKERKTAK